MKFNQYSYLPVDQADILKELKEIGFDGIYTFDQMKPKFHEFKF